jgi:hypothetical protein
MVSISGLADNDVLIKGAAYRILDSIPDVLGGPVGVLGAARYVVPDAIDRHQGLQDRNGASASWHSFLAAAVLLEPSSEEVELATAIETAAAEGGLPFDTGESQLCAIAICRSGILVVTGDKRAISAMERLQHVLECLRELAGRVACLEQLIQGLCDRFGIDEVREVVCSEPGVDRSLTVCFSCSSQQDVGVIDGAGLESYVAAVREAAPSMLARSLTST